MKREQSQVKNLLAMAVLFIATLSCSLMSRTGELQEETTSIPLDGAESVTVELRMGAGMMTVQGGAESLMEGEFVYNYPDWEPMVDYAISGEQGNLSVEQPEVRNLRIDDYRYEWDLRFHPDVLYDFDISLGAGRSTLDFSQLAVTGLNLQTGVGDVELDLSGERQYDLTGIIRGGVGRLTVFLPEESGVLVNIQGGIGSIDTGILTQTGDGYVNEAYGDAETNIRLDIEGGVGEIELRIE